MAPCWLAAVELISATASVLADGISPKIKTKCNLMFPRMASVILGSCYYADIFQSVHLQHTFVFQWLFDPLNLK